MGGVNSCHSALPVQMQVVMPSKGNKIMKSKFMKDCPANDKSIMQFFDEKIRHLLSGGGGDAFEGMLWNQASVHDIGGKEEIEVDDLNDD